MSDLYIGPNRISVDIESRAGVRQGAGPLVTVLSLDYGYRLSEAGDFNATIALADPRAKLIIPKGVLLAFYYDDEFLFRGIVEQTSKSVDRAGVLRLNVRGRDLTGELAEAPVGELELVSGGAGVTNGPQLILNAANTFNGTTWTLDTTNGFATTTAFVYGKYSGESALAALIMAAQKAGEHFRIATDGTRTIVWLRTNTSDSGVVAVQTAGEPVQAEDNPSICFIQSFQENVDAYRLITRIYPYGAGDGEMRLTLYSTTRTAPAGFTLNAAFNYISSNAAVSTVGKAIGVQVRFQDIHPISNTRNDMIAAANMLFDAALAHLKRHDAASDLKTFQLSVLKLPRRVQVGEIITVEYQDQSYSVDGEQMVILAIRTKIDSSGVRTSDLTVAGVARWLEDANREVIGGMEQGRLFTTHPQRGPNSYVTGFQKYVFHDGTNSEVAQIRFRFGPEICQLNQVAFDFETADGTQMLPLESTVRSVGGSSTTTSGGSNHSHSVTIGGHTHDVPDHIHTTNITGIPGGTHALVRLSTSGSSGFLEWDGSGTEQIFSNNTGNTTASSGGSSTPTSSAESAHTHTVTPTLTALYGVFREAAANTFNITDLDYQVNGGGWNPLSTAVTSLGSNWFRLDMTALLYDATTFVPLQSSNLLEFRRKTGGSYGTRQTCMIDGQLLVRNIIQSVSLT